MRDMSFITILIDSIIEQLNSVNAVHLLLEKKGFEQILVLQLSEFQNDEEKFNFFRRLDNTYKEFDIIEGTRFLKLEFKEADNNEYQIINFYLNCSEEVNKAYFEFSHALTDRITQEQYSEDTYDELE
jgi:hypothetical protein